MLQQLWTTCCLPWTWPTLLLGHDIPLIGGVTTKGTIFQFNDFNDLIATL
jgi:hypothetical protein